MKKATVCAVILCVLTVIFSCAFTLDPHSSLKTLTKPYAATYDCTMARLGDTDLLEDYDYLKIIITDSDKLIFEMQRKGRKKYVRECNYEYDDRTGCLSAEMGILGFTFRQKTKIENGKFVISMPILSKQLTMIFEAQ